jgi:cell wall-associated NlpC family hydrolase
MFLPEEDADRFRQENAVGALSADFRARLTASAEAVAPPSGEALLGLSSDVPAPPEAAPAAVEQPALPSQVVAPAVGASASTFTSPPSGAGIPAADAPLDGSPPGQVGTAPRPTTAAGIPAPEDSQHAGVSEPSYGTGWLGLARAQMGKPYIWGSAGGRSDFSDAAAGFDCSGFVSYVYKNALGINLPAQTASAYGATRAVAPEQARPGDVVLYNMDNPDPHVQHIAIYLGNGQVIQAGGGVSKNVNIAPVGQAGSYEFRRADGADTARANTQATATVAGAVQPPSSAEDFRRAFGERVSASVDALGQAKDAAGETKDRAMSTAGDFLSAFQQRLSQTISQADQEPPIAPPVGAPPTTPGQAVGTNVNLSTTGLPDVNAMAQSANQRLQDPAVQARIDAEAEQARANTHAFVEQNNPIRDVPVLGGLATGAAESLVDPMTYIAGPAIGEATAAVARPVLKAAAGALGRAIPEEVAYAGTQASETALARREASGLAAKAETGMAEIGGEGGGIPPRGPSSPALPEGLGGEGAGTGQSRLDEITDMFGRNNAQPSLLERAKQTIAGLPAAAERQIADKFAPINSLAGKQAEETVALFQGAKGAARQILDDTMGPAYQTLRNEPRLIEAVNVYRKLMRDMEVGLVKRDLPTLDAGGVVTDPGGINRSFSGGVQGVDDIRATLADLKQRLGPEAWDRVTTADTQIQQALDASLDRAVQSGRVAPDLAERLRAEQPHYNPTRLQSAIDDAEQQAIPGTGRQLNQTDNLLRKLTEQGTASDTEEPLQSAIRSILQGEIANRRNLAVRDIVQGLRANPETAGQVKPVNFGESTALARTDAVPTGARFVGKQPPAFDPKNSLSYYENGQRVVYSVPPEVANAAKNLDGVSMGVLADIGRALNAPTRLGTTTLNPAFLVTNAVADAVTTYIREGAGTLARVPQGYAQALFKTKTYQDFVRAGGSMEGYYARNADDLERTIRTSGGLVLKGEAGWRQVLRAANAVNPLNAIQTVGAAIEQGPRLATFSAHLAQGETAGQAALAGRRVTVDFARGGQTVQLANSWVMFLNARVQGTLQIGRTLRDNPAARWRLAGLGALAASTYAWNRQFPEYADVPDYVKDQYAVVMLPGSEKDATGPGYTKLNYLAIPLREWSAFVSPVTHVFRGMDGQDPRTWSQFAASYMGSVTPISGDTAAAGVGGLIPPVMKVPLEVQANKRFYSGMPIVSAKYADAPPSAQFDEHTSELAKRLGEQYGISPKGLDFLVAETLGGAGRLALQGADAAFGKPTEGAPVVAGLTSGVLRSYGGQLREDQYNRLQQAIDARQEPLAAQVRATPEYQRASPDAQQAMLKYAQARLVGELKAGAGIDASPRRPGEPAKYRGVEDSLQEQQIDRAISKVNAWEKDRRANPAPTAEERALARRYEDRVDPAWTRFQQQQDRSRGPLRSLADQYSGPPVPAGSPPPPR